MKRSRLSIRFIMLLTAPLLLASCGDVLGDLLGRALEATPDPVDEPPAESAQRIFATDPGPNDRFGYSVSIDGDYAIVGAPNNDASGQDAGAAYIYHRTGPNTWDSGAKIVAPDPEASAYYGYSVSICGDYALVGAIDDDSVAADAGAAYIYRRTGVNEWDEGLKITASDADSFGCSVGLSGDYAVVGAKSSYVSRPWTGAAYVFHRTGTSTWDAGVKIIAVDPGESDYFGESVAIAGDYIVVSAMLEDAGGEDAGAAYIYHREGTNAWDVGTKIVAPDPAAGDYFGTTVSINGPYAAIGARGKFNEAHSAGAAYVFHMATPGSWDGGVKITDPDPALGDQLGSVAMGGSFAVVSTSLFGSGDNFLFQREGENSWSSGTELLDADFRGSIKYGSVATSGNWVIMGAPYGNSGGQETGEACLFVLQ